MNRSVCGISLEILGPFVGSARLWESAPFVGLTLFVSLTYISSMPLVKYRQCLTFDAMYT